MIFIKLLTADLDDTEFKAIAQGHVPDLAFVAARKLEPLLPLVGTGMTTDQICIELERRAHYAQFGKREPDLSE